MGDGSAAGGENPARSSSWLRRIARVPDAVEKRHLQILGVVAFASFFEEYDLAMLTSALKYIAADLGIREAELPDLLAVVRLGAIPAFAFIPYADRVGRRRVFLISVFAMSALTFLTAFVRTSGEFVAIQMLTRTFFVAGSAVAFVFIAEEFPARHRGYGVGLLGALSISGHGLSAGLFGFIDHLPFGWRILYAVGGFPLLVFPFLARALPETTRYTASVAERVASDEASRSAPAGEHGASGGVFGWVRPLRDLAAERPTRALAMALAGLLPSFGIIGTFQFTGYYTQAVRGWTPREYAAMVVVAGAVGVVGNVVAGRLADRFGRRSVGAVLLASFPVCASLFYLGDSWMLPLAWSACIFSAQGGRAILRALSTELFPTSYRGTAAGLFTVLDVVGAALGLFVLGRLLGASRDLSATIPWVAAVTAIGAIVVLALPETSQKELEAIS